MRKVVASVALLVAAGGTAPADDRHLVSQKGRQFHPTSLQIEVGDVVVFQNDDRTDHHIMAVEGPSEFSSHLLPRGSSFEVTFDKTGRWEIGCRIHPRMKLILQVEDSSPAAR